MSSRPSASDLTEAERDGLARAAIGRLRCYHNGERFGCDDCYHFRACPQRELVRWYDARASNAPAGPADEEVVPELVIELVADLFSIGRHQARANCAPCDEPGLYLAGHPERGFGSIVIDRTGGVLYGAASVEPDALVREFLDGRRTPRVAFRYLHTRRPAGPADGASSRA